MSRLSIRQFGNNNTATIHGLGIEQHYGGEKKA